MHTFLCMRPPSLSRLHTPLSCHLTYPTAKRDLQIPPSFQNLPRKLPKRSLDDSSSSCSFFASTHVSCMMLFKGTSSMQHRNCFNYSHRTSWGSLAGSVVWSHFSVFSAIKMGTGRVSTLAHRVVMRISCKVPDTK